MSENKLAPVDSINRLIRENRVSDFASPNLALGMRPLEFGAGDRKSVVWGKSVYLGGGRLI